MKTFIRILVLGVWFQYQPVCQWICLPNGVCRLLCQ